MYIHEKQLPKINSRNTQNSQNAFVTNEFCTWKNASIRLKKHDNSEFYKKSQIALNNYKKTSVIEHIAIKNRLR